MDFSSHLFLLLIGGCMIGLVRLDCLPSRCEAIFPRQSLKQVLNAPPSENKLSHFCPKLIEYVDCVDGLIPTCTGKRLSALARSDRRDVAENATLLMNIRELIVDLCTEQTKLHKDYVAAVQCYKRVVRNPDMNCYQDKFIIAKAKQHKTGILIPRRHETDQCLGMKAQTDCFSIKVRDQCGSDASKTFLGIRTAIKPFSMGVCSWGALQEVKDDFIAYLIERSKMGHISTPSYGGKGRGKRAKCKLGVNCKKIKKPAKTIKWSVA